MFKLMEKLDRAYEGKLECTLIDKLGKYYHGKISDSWVRLSGGKMRGKLVFESHERGLVEPRLVEIDVNDIFDIIIKGEK